MSDESVVESLAVAAAPIALEAGKKLFIALGKYLATMGEDPKALLNAQLDAADAGAVAELESLR